MAHERVGHSLQATALVNEAYLRLVDVRQMKWQDRAHFFAMSALRLPLSAGYRVHASTARQSGPRLRQPARMDVTAVLTGSV